MARTSGSHEDWTDVVGPQHLHQLDTNPEEGNEVSYELRDGRLPAHQLLPVPGGLQGKGQRDTSKEDDTTLTLESWRPPESEYW